MSFFLVKPIRIALFFISSYRISLYNKIICPVFYCIAFFLPLKLLVLQTKAVNFCSYNRRFYILTFVDSFPVVYL